MIKSAIIIIAGIILTLIATITSLFFSFIDWTNGNVNFYITKLWSKLILFVSGIRIEVKGRENIITNGPQIFACNHQSAYDIFVLLAVIPVQFRWIAKKELFNIPLFGWAMARSGQIQIDRQNRTKAFNSLTRATEKIKSGYSVVIFPEGTRSKDGRISEFKRGSLLLATKAEEPIIPTTIVGTYDILPKGRLKINSRSVKVIFNKPIETKNLEKTAQKELVNKLRQIIVDDFNRSL